MNKTSQTPEADALEAKDYRIVGGKATKDFSNSPKSLHELPQIGQNPTKAAKGEKIRVDKTTRENALKTILQEVAFVVPGEPIPKGRGRTFTHNKTRKSCTLTPKRTVAYERKVKVAALAAMVNKERFEFGVKMTAHFYRNTKQRCDWDNLAKAICDACNGIVFDDDSQIVDAHITKAFGDRPRAEIIFEGKVLK